jgi:hypothetical protein
MAKNRLVVPAGQLRRLGDLTHDMENQILKTLKLAKELSNVESTAGQHLESYLQQAQHIANAIRAECSCLTDYLSLNGMGRTIKPRESNRNSERSASDD